MYTGAHEASPPGSGWASLLGTAGGNPFQELLGLVIEQIEPVAVVTMPLNEMFSGLRPRQHTQGAQPIQQSIHGGALATLVDVTCAMALAPKLHTSTEMQVTTEMNVRYYRQPRASPLTAEARVVHRGRRLAGVECVIKDADDHVIVRGHATYMIVTNPHP
jgi:uncharacterized protein (TIGR00369 family)